MNERADHMDETGVPEEVRGVAQALDALGRTEREGTPAGLVDRICLASRPGVIGRIGPAWIPRAAKLAAAVVVLAAIGLGARLWFATDNETEAAMLEADFDAWLTLEDAGAFETAYGERVSDLLADSQVAAERDEWSVSGLAEMLEGSPL